MSKTCGGCGELFIPKRSSQKYCVKDCGRTTQARNKSRTDSRELRVFIGVDGEGVTYCRNCYEVRDNTDECPECEENDWAHDYVLLSVGQESLVREDGGHLSYRDIFPFLYKEYEKNPNAAFVGYYLGYDFTQWMRTLPESRAKSLLTPEGISKRTRKLSGGNPKPFPVHIGEWEWEIDILGLKRFKLRPGTGFPPGIIKNTSSWMTICDAGAFFQQRFTGAIKSEVGKLITQEEYDTIVAGKERRSDAILDDDMIRYNLLENDILGRVMAQLNDGFKATGIALTKEQWFGPGQAAQAWLNNIMAPPGEMVRAAVPDWALEAARMSYYGGWFEIFRHGMVPGTSYEYDINSAYPYIISKLPCLLHGEWNYTEYDGAQLETLPAMSENTLRLYHGVALGSNRYVGALPHRTKDGRVLRPQNTSGWYWHHEVQAAINAGLIDEFRVTKSVQYDACRCDSPFKSIADLYQLRLQVGKETSHGKAYKLIYNSAYGKMAQSIGSPKYANSIYASLITTGCRTMILEAIATHPTKTNDLLMVATDGVYFRTPHPTLDLDEKRLGAWGSKSKENLTLFMPGIYWDDKSREALRDGEDPKLKSRGISASDLAACIDDIDIQFATMSMDDTWPAIELPVKFNMVTAKLAIARGKWNTCGKITFDGVKKMNSSPHTKRDPSMWPDGSKTGVMMTLPYLMSERLESTPYEKRFGDEMEEIMSEIEVTQDGIVTNDFTEMLGIKDG